MLTSMAIYSMYKVSIINFLLLCYGYLYLSAFSHQSLPLLPLLAFLYASIIKNGGLASAVILEMMKMLNMLCRQEKKVTQRKGPFSIWPLHTSLQLK